MLKYPCLVLDHDDTVVQTERAVGYPYFRDYIEKIRPGMTLSFPEYVKDCNNMIFADMCRKRWQFTDKEMREEYEGWKAYSRIHIPPIFAGIDRIIKRQKEEGGLICVASLSTSEMIQRDYLHHFGFLPDAIYDNDLPFEKRKPAIYPLEDIMNRFSLSSKDILVLDDMKLGWSMAEPLHIHAAYAAWSKKDFPELANQMEEIFTYTFDSTEKLYNFLFCDLTAVI